MKKLVLSMMIVILLLSGCAKKNTGPTLDQTLAETAAFLDSAVASGTKIALVTFESPTEKFSEYVLTELAANLTKGGKLTVVDPKIVTMTRNELLINISDALNDVSLSALGMFLGTQSVLTGDLSESGGSYRITVKVLNTQNGNMQAQHRQNFNADKKVRDLLKK